MPELRLLLPPASSAGKAALGAAGLARLGKGRRLEPAVPGRRAQLQRCYRIEPPGWPVAALSRQADVGDAGSAAWLRADPAYLRPDMAGARLMAEGAGLMLDASDVDALLPALAAVCAEAGCGLDAPHPARWYLRLPAAAVLPDFADPDDALGEDVFDHMPRGPAARPWRRLQSEAEVLLHNHPWNRRRAASGKPPVNGLWLWGGGVLPDSVIGSHPRTFSDDPACHALAAAAGESRALPPAFVVPPGPAIVDVATLRDATTLGRDWLQPALAALHDGRLRRLCLDWADGVRFELEPAQRWRFWRKPLAGFAP